MAKQKESASCRSPSIKKKAKLQKERRRLRKTAYKEYMDEIKKSDGFYVTQNKDGSLLPGGVIPVAREDSNERLFRKADRAAQFAVEEYSREIRCRLLFDRVLKLNTQYTDIGTIYYITMHVFDNSRDHPHYEAKILKRYCSGYELQICRKAPYFKGTLESCSKGSFFVKVGNLIYLWMDKSYLYYKCFNSFCEDIWGIECEWPEKGFPGKAIVNLKSWPAYLLLELRFAGQLMPLTADTVYVIAL